MKQFFLSCDMQEHIVSLEELGSTAEFFPTLPPHKWGQVKKALAFSLGTVSAHQNNHMMTLLTR